jgi:protein SCO1/2
MKNSVIALLLLFTIFSCGEKPKPLSELPSDSIFHLPSSWQNQHGDTMDLNKLRGKNLVVVMIYTSCKTACPLLVSNMKQIEGKINKNKLASSSLVLVSIDPATDTPENLLAFAKKNEMNEPHWIFLRSTEDATLEFANVLSMKYKKISAIDFSHSNIISVFNKEGQLVLQEEGTQVDIEKIAGTINKLD